VAWAVTSGKVLLKSDGTPWRPIVHIEDISRASWRSWPRPPLVSAEAFNVGKNDQNYRIREIAEIVQGDGARVRGHLRRGCRPDKRNYRPTFQMGACSRIQPLWTLAKVHASSLRRTAVWGSMSPSSRARATAHRSAQTLINEVTSTVSCGGYVHRRPSAA